MGHGDDAQKDARVLQFREMAQNRGGRRCFRLFEYENGATGVFITCTADTPGTNRFEILGTGGKLVCEDNILKVWKLEQDEREFNATYKGGFGEPKCTYEEIRPQGENPQHVGILNNFANAILGLEPLFVDGREGLAGVTLMDSMLLSTWKDKNDRSSV